MLAPAGRPTLVQLRLWAGVIVGVFVTMHLANHALGLVSLDAQERARPYFMWFWHTWPGQVLLYGALLTHSLLVFPVLLRRRHYRMPRWQVVQILAGIAIPYLLIIHIVNTRGTRILTGIDIDYVYENTMLWVSPVTRLKQVILVLLVWGHFAMGLHFWLRIYPWYRKAVMLAMVLYVLVPTASLLGFAQAGMEVGARARQDGEWYKSMRKRGVPADRQRAIFRAGLQDWAGPVWLGIVGLFMTYTVVRHWRTCRRTFTVTYPQGERVKAPCGMSILEVSRMAGRPHMSVCGGRARCTTCRVLVVDGLADLPPPGTDEARALERINAPKGLRLACQLRPEGDVSVQPLMKPTLLAGVGGIPVPGPDGMNGASPEFGQERQVTVLFIDLRGSTRLAEKRLPYDIVFLLNHFLEEMAAAVEASNGFYSNFTGDGLMALFGLEASPDHGARAALSCAANMLERLELINERLVDEVETPLKVGIGIHTGLAIVGKMGPPKAPFVTALGDTVNTAARLESLTKELKSPVAASVATLDAAGMPHPPLCEVELRGRTSRLAVASLDMEAVQQLLWSPLPKSMKEAATADAK